MKKFAIISSQPAFNTTFLHQAMLLAPEKIRGEIALHTLGLSKTPYFLIRR